MPSKRQAWEWARARSGQCRASRRRASDRTRVSCGRKSLADPESEGVFSKPVCLEIPAMLKSCVDGFAEPSGGNEHGGGGEDDARSSAGDDRRRMQKER